jgi:hypothetical protein
MIKRFWNWIRGLFGKKVKSLDDYHVDKARDIIVNGGVKIKLRKYIAHLATKLCSMNNDGRHVNRMRLVGIYNAKGLKGVVKYYNKTSKEYYAGLRSNIKNRLEKIKSETV